MQMTLVGTGVGASVALYRRAAGQTNRDDRVLIADAVAAFSGMRAEDVVVAAHCRRCGSDEHGKPRILAPAVADGSTIQVSLSRAGDQVVVAVTSGHPLGCDVEDPAALTTAVAAAPLDEVALHPDERRALAAMPREERAHRRVLLWTAKEAVLKATGWGLAIEPSTLSITVPADDVLTLTSWPAELGLDDPPHLGVIELPETDAGGRLLCTIAVLR